MGIGVIFSLSLLHALVLTPHFLSLSLYPNRTPFRVQSAKGAATNYIAIEALSDTIFHFEMSLKRPFFPHNRAQHIYTSPMVSKIPEMWDGPTRFDESGGGGSADTTYTTASAEALVSPTSSKITISYKGKEVTQFAPDNLDDAVMALTFTQGSVSDVYGLGQHFMRPLGSMNGNFMGKQWKLANNIFGNAAFPLMEPDWRGTSELTQMPIFYGLGPQNQTFGVFVDSQYRMEWFFDQNPFRAETWGRALRWFVILGDNLPQVRQQYMQLTGYSPVPPKRMMGLWQSIFGYRSWDHVNNDLDSLVAPSDSFMRFPVDGVAYDIYWFGGKFYQGQPEWEAEESRMGDLMWDLSKFPDVKKSLAAIEKKGASAMLISESYVSLKTKNFKAMSNRFGFAKSCNTCGPDIWGRKGENHWWGVGAMCDWSREDSSDYFFDCKYCPLIEGCKVNADLCHDNLADPTNPSRDAAKISAFWLDLGEPEMFHDYAIYRGFIDDDATLLTGHADYHNMHQLLWNEAIARGYERNKIELRPWILTRSGTSGIQRTGASMWSGDIWPDLANMANSLQQQMHLSLAGIDYFGSDVGGFHRNSHDITSEGYTQWFANSCWFDVPVRPHTWQPDGSPLQTAPSRVGHVPSNLFNIRTRLSLLPYYYSLAHRASRFAEPVIPPMVYYYQFDSNTRQMGAQKLIGRDIIVGASSTEGQRSRDVYLPRYEWYNYYTNEYLQTPGHWERNVPQAHADKRYCKDGSACLFVLPAFVRGGAIIPRMIVDEHSMNSLGQRDDGSRADDLLLRVYASAMDFTSSFTLYEDDGETVAYKRGAVRSTTISQAVDGPSVVVTVGGAQGTYTNAPLKRQQTIEFVSHFLVEHVAVEDSPLLLFTDLSKFENASSGWYRVSRSEVWAKTGSRSVFGQTHLRFAADIPAFEAFRASGQSLKTQAEKGERVEQS